MLISSYKWFVGLHLIVTTRMDFMRGLFCLKLGMPFQLKVPFQNGTFGNGTWMPFQVKIRSKSTSYWSETYITSAGSTFIVQMHLYLINKAESGHFVVSASGVWHTFSCSKTVDYRQLLFFFYIVLCFPVNFAVMYSF